MIAFYRPIGDFMLMITIESLLSLPVPCGDVLNIVVYNDVETACACSSGRIFILNKRFYLTYN